MCLYSVVSTPCIAKEPIKCYKLLSIIGDKIVTPYRLVDIPDIPYFFIAKGKREYIPHYLTFEVTSGYIHAYTNLRNAIKESSSIDKVFECVIPEGAFYYIGEYGDICATSMLIQQYNTI